VIAAKRCVMCGGAVPQHGEWKRDYQSGTNTFGPKYRNEKHGQPNVSSDMTAIDPTGLFCTMRCAAKYGVFAYTNAKAKP
jgi:hypothetical protein